jgi:hypothetical protein
VAGAGLAGVDVTAIGGAEVFDGDGVAGAIGEGLDDDVIAVGADEGGLEGFAGLAGPGAGVGAFFFDLGGEGEGGGEGEEGGCEEQLMPWGAGLHGGIRYQLIRWWGGLKG